MVDGFDRCNLLPYTEVVVSKDVDLQLKTAWCSQKALEQVTGSYQIQLSWMRNLGGTRNQIDLVREETEFAACH